MSKELYDKILSLPCNPRRGNHPSVIAYKAGHRDARHAAAELFSTPSATPQVELCSHSAVVYPPDGTVSPFTVINLGHGLVKMGDSLHDGRLPALWFGKDGLGMGVAEEMNRAAKEGETLAVVTFSNVEGLDVLMEVIQRIRSASFPDAPILSAAAPQVVADEFESLVAQFIDIIGVTDTGDTLVDARSAINKLHKVMAAPVQPVAVPDGAVIKAAQALLDEHKAACLSDPMNALIEMADDDEEASVSAALLADLFRALNAAPAAQGDALGRALENMFSIEVGPHTVSIVAMATEAEREADARGEILATEPWHKNGPSLKKATATVVDAAIAAKAAS